MNIRIDTLKTLFDWQTVRIVVDGPIWDLQPVWKQADEIVTNDNLIAMIAYEQVTPVGYILYNVTDQKITMTGISRSIPEESRQEIRNALNAELSRILESKEGK